MKFKAWIGLTILALGLSACSNLGSVALPPDRLAFNGSLSNSNEQQALLNIVRLRYTDSPYFLSVNNVVSQFSFGSSFGTNIANSSPPPALLGSASANFNYSEAPTITYTPLQGEDYIDRLLTPIELEVVYMLLRSGWSVHHLTPVLIQRMGEYENAVLASRPISGRIPIYKSFKKLMGVFRRLQDDENMVISKDKINGVFAIKVKIKHYSQLSTEDLSILSHFAVSASSPQFWLVKTPSKEKNNVYLEPRTMLGMFYYLSKGVVVPEYDIEHKQALMTYYKDGKAFDWTAVVNGVIRVRSCRSKPINAYVAVPYRGSWFYIRQTDFISKETLNLHSILMGIYQGKIQSTLPVFTVS